MIRRPIFRPLPALLAGPVLSLFLCLAPAAAAEVRYPLGSRVGLEPPAGMTQSETSPRFEDKARDAVITVLDLPGGAYDEIQRGLFAPASDPGVTVRARETFLFNGGAGYLVEIGLTVDGKPRDKWILLARSLAPDSADLTAVVTVDMPDSARDVYPAAAVRAALASISFRPNPVDEQLSLMPIRLSDQSGFRVVRAIPSAGVLLTDGPLDQSPDQPSMIISVSPQPPLDSAERANFGQQLLSSMGLPDLRITSAETIRMRGQPTYEVKAQARDGATRTPLSIIQWMRFGEGGYLRILAIAPTAAWADSYPRFRAVRDGIESR